MQAFLISRLKNKAKRSRRTIAVKGMGKLGELSTGLKNELA